MASSSDAMISLTLFNSNYQISVMRHPSDSILKNAIKIGYKRVNTTKMDTSTRGAILRVEVYEFEEVLYNTVYIFLIVLAYFIPIFS